MTSYVDSFNAHTMQSPCANTHVYGVKNVKMEFEKPPLPCMYTCMHIRILPFLAYKDPYGHAKAYPIKYAIMESALYAAIYICPINWGTTGIIFTAYYSYLLCLSTNTA